MIDYFIKASEYHSQKLANLKKDPALIEKTLDQYETYF